MDINKPVEAVEIARSKLTDKRKEHFIALYLNVRNKVIYSEVVSLGTLDANLVHPREVFRPAIAKSAGRIITLHNHPSGEVDPSDDDIELSKRLKEAGKIIGISILDNIVFNSRGDFYSFESNNIM